MFGLFSSNKPNTDKARSGSQDLRPIRGLKSGVGVCHPASGTFGSLGHGQIRGRSSVVQDMGGTHPNVLGLLLTDEPCSVAGTGGGTIGRGRRAPTEAAAPAAPSRVQALALQQSGMMIAEKLKPDEFLQPTLVAEIEARENAMLHEEAYVGPPKVYARRRLRRNQSPRFPLQIGTDPPFLSKLADEERPQPSRRSSVYEHLVGLPRTSKTPLQATLFSGSRNLCSAPPPTPPTTSTTSALHMLAVGVAYDNLQDPQHDLGLLTTLFEDHQSEKTQFKGISGDKVTPQIIEQAIGDLYRKTLKSSGSNLLVLLTGEGNEENKMYLMDNVFITDQDLRRWMWKLQIDCYPNNRTVTIILDYCRKNPNIGPGKSLFGVEFIWSCSPGQTAAALRFSGTQNISLPRSCFLLALMMSSYRFAYAKNNLVTAVDHELQQLLRLLKLTHRKTHETGQCGYCNRKEECQRPYRPQDPDWQQAGSMKSIYDLVDRLSTTDMVSKVYGQITRNRYFREANGLPAEDATFNLTPSHQAALTRHNRGSSKPVHAASNTRSDFHAESSRTGSGFY